MDYSNWNNYNRKMDFSNMNIESNFYKNEYSKVSTSKRVSEVVIGIFCFFIPCVGVLLYEDAITNNFWVSIIGMILIYIPGIVFAFLVCFGGVSVN